MPEGFSSFFAYDCISKKLLFTLWGSSLSMDGLLWQYSAQLHRVTVVQYNHSLICGPQSRSTGAVD